MLKYRAKNLELQQKVAEQNREFEKHLEIQYRLVKKSENTEK
jgi:hypothetical protein